MFSDGTKITPERTDELLSRVRVTDQPVHPIVAQQLAESVRSYGTYSRRCVVADLILRGIVTTTAERDSAMGA